MNLKLLSRKELQKECTPLACLFMLGCVVATTLLPAAACADLRSDISRILNDKYLAKAEVGVAVARLSDSKAAPALLVQVKEAKPLIPASNLKLISTGAAVDRLGADFKFTTSLLSKNGDVYLIGDGDPTLGDVEMLKKAGWNVDTVFSMWAEELKRKGITSVGNLIVDDSVFDEQFFHPNWPLDQAHKRYVSEVGGVNLNANCIDFYLRTGGFGATVDFTTVPDTRYASIANTCVFGDRNAVWLSRHLSGNDIVLRGETNASNREPISVTIHDPALFAATVLRETLVKNGIMVNGSVMRDRTAGATARREGQAMGWKAIAAIQTPLATVLARANKDSMNLYAEALCKRTGFAASGEPGSWANGTAAMEAFLAACGVAGEQFSIDDGCGLSKENRISAEAIVRVLAHFHAGNDAELYRNSMAISGIDGTLDNRFRSGTLRGRVFGKSGYVNNVSALSGYVHARDGEWYAFSILMNDVPSGTNHRAKEIQEKIVEAIDGSVASVAAGE